MISIGAKGIGIMNSGNGETMSGQPSPYSTPSDDQRDAARFRLVLQLTRLTVSEMSPQEKAVWDRIILGGWFVDDLVARLDALLALRAPVGLRGGQGQADVVASAGRAGEKAGTEQE